ncbi:MAG: GlsB/YeaQ/YmgE family stress response membrane protein [Oscillochloris sp.]|nr:GlsB/YeaQ/YmgE family stress response membrane protein [Oscillochloris sp.]
MGLITWIIFGGLAGWVASLIAGTSRRQGCLLNVIVGVVGAMLGGAVMEFLTGTPVNFTFRPGSFVVAVIGALILLTIVNAAQKRK